MLRLNLGCTKDATDEPMKRGAPIAPAMRVKGELYAWLAWREQPSCPLGQSIFATVLRHDSPLAGAFMGGGDRPGHDAPLRTAMMARSCADPS